MLNITVKKMGGYRAVRGRGLCCLVRADLGRAPAAAGVTCCGSLSHVKEGLLSTRNSRRACSMSTLLDDNCELSPNSKWLRPSDTSWSFFKMLSTLHPILPSSIALLRPAPFRGECTCTLDVFDLLFKQLAADSSG